jgi:hypothetical protein
MYPMECVWFERRVTCDGCKHTAMKQRQKHTHTYAICLDCCFALLCIVGDIIIAIYLSSVLG